MHISTSLFRLIRKHTRLRNIHRTRRTTLSSRLHRRRLRSSKRLNHLTRTYRTRIRRNRINQTQPTRNIQIPLRLSPSRQTIQIRILQLRNHMHLSTCSSLRIREELRLRNIHRTRRTTLSSLNHRRHHRLNSLLQISKRNLKLQLRITNNLTIRTSRTKQLIMLHQTSIRKLYSHYALLTINNLRSTLHKRLTRIIHISRLPITKETTRIIRQHHRRPSTLTLSILNSRNRRSSRGTQIIFMLMWAWIAY